MKKVVFITGISSGFGFEIAKQLVKNGHIVYGTIRSKCETPHGVHVLEMDLTDSDSIQKAIQSVIENETVLDVVINNAGMHSGGPIEDIAEEVYRKHFETNIFGFMQIIQLSLPYLRKSKQATLINISSIGGLTGLPFQGIYSATKFAIEGISQALRTELKPYNVNVVVVNPGDFRTKNTASRVKSIKEDSVYALSQPIENDE
jgi:NAD(P)-dependent dehydrogenase (short-subunit alcohol dehydrogenase family)